MLWNNDQPRTCDARYEIGEVPRHRLLVVCQEEASFARSLRQNISITQPGQTCCQRTLEIYRGFTSNRSYENKLIQVRIGLKTHLH